MMKKQDGQLNEPQPAEDARMEELQRRRRDNDNYDDEEGLIEELLARDVSLCHWRISSDIQG